MLGGAATAHRAAERRADQLAVEAVLELRQAGPPLGVARARGHVDRLVARDPDVALEHEHGEGRRDREREADPLRLDALHWRASAAKQIRRSGDTARATNVTSAGPGVVVCLFFFLLLLLL